MNWHEVTRAFNDQNGTHYQWSTVIAGHDGAIEKIREQLQGDPLAVEIVNGA